MENQKLHPQPTLDSEMAAIVADMYKSIRTGTNPEDYAAEYGHLGWDIKDIGDAIDAFIEDDQRYTFVARDNGELSITHFIAFCLVTSWYSYKTSILVDYSEIAKVIRNHFLTVAKKAYTNDEESLLAAFDSTFSPELLAVYCYVFSLHTIGEAPY